MTDYALALEPDSVAAGQAAELLHDAPIPGTTGAGGEGWRPLTELAPLTGYVIDLPWSEP